MVLSAAQRDDMLITSSDLIRANSLVTRLEDDMPFVFSKIGQESDALHVGRMLSYLEKTGGASYQEAYRQVHTNFPQAKDFEEVLNGAVRAGLVRLEQRNGGIWLAPAED
jgi:hypothetical protein